MRLRFFLHVGSLAIGACLSLSGQAQITWRRTYGGFGSDQAHSVRQTGDGGYIIAGTAGSFGSGSSDIYVLRTDELGEPLWSRTYGGPGVEQGVACRELADGYIIAGYTSLGSNGSYDMLLIRTDLSGNPLWEKQYGTSDWDLCNAFDVLPDGFVLGGISYGPGTSLGAAFVVRTDANGEALWTSRTPEAHRMECKGIGHTADGGIVLVGSIGTDSGLDDGFIRKLDADGSEAWTTFVGGDSLDYLGAVFEKPDGDLIACGGTHSFNNTLQIYLMGVHADGSAAWEDHQGSTADAAATDIRMDHMDGYVFTGYNTLNLGEPDMILTTTFSEGGFRFGNNYGDGRPAQGFSIDTTSDGGYVVAGWSEDFGPGLRSMYVVKTDDQGQTADLTVETYLDPLKVEDSGSGREGALLFPNPVRPGGTVFVNGLSTDPGVVTITDPQGREVLRIGVAPGQRMLNIPSLADGVYLLRAFDGKGNGLFTAPLVLQR